MAEFAPTPAARDAFEAFADEHNRGTQPEVKDFVVDLSPEEAVTARVAAEHYVVLKDELTEKLI